MTVVFVSALYNVSNNDRYDEIWARFATLSATLPTFLVCSPKDAHRVPPNVTPYYVEFEDLVFYKVLSCFKGLPAVRSVEKDTKHFMILMNAKAEFLKYAKERMPADHYFWIDAGIGKIFSDPPAIYHQIQTLSQIPLNREKILLPGCWAHNTYSLNDLATKISWRFAGGFFAVPADLIHIFFNAVLESALYIAERTGVLTWEVNVWCLVESHIPIQWVKADHNETIIKGLLDYAGGA